MEIIFLALGLYVLGGSCLFWPERWELFAHRAGCLLSAAASFLVFLAAADCLFGWGLAVPRGKELLPFLSWGQFSLQGISGAQLFWPSPVFPARR